MPGPVKSLTAIITASSSVIGKSCWGCFVRILWSLTMPSRGVWEYRDTGHVVKGGMVNVFTVESGKITSYEVYADTAAFADGFRGTTTKA